jgi:hypothetical protein
MLITGSFVKGEAESPDNRTMQAAAIASEGAISALLAHECLQRQ